MAFQKKNAGKKADLLSIWWFLVLAVIAVGVSIGVFMFGLEKIDARYLEAGIISDKIIMCLSDNGHINNDFLNNNFDIFSKCALNKQFVDASGNYFIKISVTDLNTGQPFMEPRKYGNNAFEKDCPIGAAVLEAEKYPKCSENTIILSDSENHLLKLNVEAGSNLEHR